MLIRTLPANATFQNHDLLVHAELVFPPLSDLPYGWAAIAFFLVVFAPAVHDLQPGAGIRTLNHGRISLEAISWVGIALLLVSGITNLILRNQVAKHSPRQFLYNRPLRQTPPVRRHGVSSLLAGFQVRAEDRVPNRSGRRRYRFLAGTLAYSLAEMVPAP